MPHIFNVQVLLVLSIYFFYKYTTKMIGYAVLLIVVILVAALAYYYFTQIQGEPSQGSTLTITENGTTLTEGYRIMPKSEAYIQMPEVYSCGRDNEKSYCPSYEGTVTNGFAYVYDLSLSDITTPEYTECPGGGHDCWFIEKYDSEGTMIGVVNKNGESLLDKLTDDIWDDKLDMDTAMVSDLLGRMEFKNGKLVSKIDFDMTGNITFAVGDEFKITDSPLPSLYFLILLLAMKAAGVEKPGTITLNVKNAKEKFDARKPQ
jgi:hypothetical protein